MLMGSCSGYTFIILMEKSDEVKMSLSMLLTFLHSLVLCSLMLTDILCRRNPQSGRDI